MDLKRYLPNKTLLWKELKTDGPTILLFWVYITLTSSFLLFRIASLLDALKQGYQIHGMGISVLMDQINHVITLETGGQGFLLTFLVIFLAAWNFGLERQQNTFSLLLAMPYSRRDVIYNKFIVGIGQLVIIFVLNAAVMTMLVWANHSIPFPSKTIDIWWWALQNIIILGFVYSFTMFICAISGTQLGNILLSLIFLFLPFGLFVLIGFNSGMWKTSPLPWLFYDSMQYVVMAMTVPFYLISNSVIAQHFNMALLYSIIFIASIVFYCLTQYLFSKNQLENNGEILMFSKLEGFFKLGVAIFLTLLSVPVAVHLLNLNPPHGSTIIIYMFMYLILAALSWWFINWLFKWRREGVRQRFKL